MHLQIKKRGSLVHKASRGPHPKGCDVDSYPNDPLANALRNCL